MSYTVIIAEKPDAAKKIAESLADEKPIVLEKNGVKYYKFTINGKEHICIPAVGHLFTLLPKGKGWNYPIFDFEWSPTYLRKESAWTEKYLKNFQELSKNTSELIGATDFDMEGEVILFNILRYIFNAKDAKRMKFSTLTKEELMNSYRNAYDHILFPMVESGITRHSLDALWGFNLTRALTLSLRNNGNKLFSVLSTGRVQGPCLALIYEREQEIRNFKPVPYWQAKLILEINGKLYIANYEEEKLWKKEEAEKLKESCKLVKEALVEDKKTRQYRQPPPVPFNTTDLQAESFNQFKFSPRQTLDIAEELYQKGWISYPRSASQKLPSTIGYEKILKAAATIPHYREFVEEILKKKVIKPIEGKKEDPAHPSVHITSEAPKLQELTSQQKKIYDLVARRTLAAFGDDAIRESTRIVLNVNGNKFILSGKVTISPGWMKIYEPYLSIEEQILPQINIGNKIKIVKIEIVEKQTEPPPRYTQGSIIKELEDRNLGTRATRAEILQTLYDRHYIEGKSIKITPLGEAVLKVLKDFSPSILSEELTRHFEQEMDLVFNGKKTKEEVIEEAKQVLTPILTNFKVNQEKIGTILSSALKIFLDDESTLGDCPSCKSGKLVIRKNKKGNFFVGCSNYPLCKVTYPLPHASKIVKTGKVCNLCGTPIVKVIRKGKRTFEMCLAPNCPSKKEWASSKNNTNSY
ncbi:MAG: DNA topoisomerase I [Thermoproteota archaeon]|nr:DNA topoisomerase I [Candidatus Brockarchaeota archaeon]